MTVQQQLQFCPTRERCSATFNGVYQSDAIYKAMIREAKYPPDLFEGSPETLTALKTKIDASALGRFSLLISVQALPRLGVFRHSTR